MTTQLGCITEYIEINRCGHSDHGAYLETADILASTVSIEEFRHSFDYHGYVDANPEQSGGQRNDGKT